MPFGAYLLLKRLAVGGMAELFLAKDTRTGRLLVLKRILPYLAEEAEFVRMFLDEARIAASLHHPNIVEVFELGHLDGSTFIAMEWVDGIDLRRVLSKEQSGSGALPPHIAAWLVARLCEGLQHAHDAVGADGLPLGIIHRDVSPQNVMVGFNGAVKLVDFGIAKATSWMDRSKPGVIKGKFLYLAPEQLGSEPLDHRMDLFSLGVMLYELTCGKSPFHRTSTEAVIYAIRMEEPEPPSRVRRGFPAALEKVILRCLVKDRARRYQSAAEVRTALEKFVAAEGTTRDDVIAYVTRHFGDESERTHVYIPPNAEKPGPPVPEGRRETGETLAPPPRPRNPWDVELTAPMPTDPMGAPPAPSAPRREAGLSEAPVEPTALSAGGQHKLRVGEVYSPLIPTMDERPAVPRSNFYRDPEETRAAPTTPPPPLPARRSVVQASKPPPPLPSTEIPEVVSVVSAGDDTLGAADEEPPPARTTKPPPRRRGPPRNPAARPRRPMDSDDFLQTVDQARFSLLGRLTGSRTLMIILGVAAVLMGLLLLLVLWPRGSQGPVEPERPGAPPPPPSFMRVTIKPGKGVDDILVDGKPYRAGEVLELRRGNVSVKYSCPGKKKGSRLQRASTAMIETTDAPVEVPISCT